jgi:hypothetical protein
MATPQLSPGVLVREVDLTVGRADNVLDNIGAIAGPFSIGPIEEAVDITTEQELIDIFGKPSSNDAQYEYWMSASSYLSYGGVLKVVRVDGANLRTANSRRIRTGELTGISTDIAAGVSTVAPGTYTVNEDDYTTDGNGSLAILSVTVANDGTSSTDYSVLIVNGGSGFIPGDLITVPKVSLGGTIGADSVVFEVDTIYTTSGISTVGDTTLKIKNFENYEAVHSDDLASYIFAAKHPGSWANNLKVCIIDDKADQTLEIGAAAIQANGIVPGMAVTKALTGATLSGIGTTSSFTGILKGIVTGVQEDSIDVKIISRVAENTTTDIYIDYQEEQVASSFRTNDDIDIVLSNGSTLVSGLSVITSVDWYDQQTLDLANSLIYWKSIAPKPITNGYVTERNGKNDAIHVVVIDDTGEVTGIQGNILERHLNLSKASDAVSQVNAPQRIWWKEYLARYSNYLYVGDNPSDNSNNEEIYQTGFSSGFTPYGVADGLWNEPAQDKVFSAIGNATYALLGGQDYASNGGLKADLGGLFDAYNLFSNRDEIAVDYLIMGPGLDNKFESQAKANHLISIAGNRKDCIAVISPHRADVVNQTNANTQTTNIIEFFAPLSSSSYAIFDSGYKYTYDRFNNKFRYIPCNADIAGLCVRTSIFSYPWFSPAGQQRGILNGAIKLAYNPNKAQRDKLYPLRVNAIVNQPGVGILLFGDKTALGYASAFDRINVRRLFLTVEQALERSAQAQLFELNDQVTRSNFVNIVEPYLRDVKAKRGLYDFLVICDETNNTPDVIDNNEFRADIYLKPTKSINYVTLTFVATRTGVSFEEVAGRV